MNTVNLFYEEPDPDRWIAFDRYPRRLIRRLVRGKAHPGGVGMIILNLIKGFDKLKIPYRLNDYNYIRKNPDEIACIIGKPHVLFERKWKNPIIFGPGIYSHPMECPELFEKYPNVKLFLVPGDWMKAMFTPYYHNKVLDWPVGINTDVWSPAIKEQTEYDFLIYDKIRWNHRRYKEQLIDPICEMLNTRNLKYQFIHYGSYRQLDLMDKIAVSKNVLFLCEHETQGLAYQQILATGTPMLAWEQGGYWKDPYYYPEKVKYQPVSAVPYWDQRCGMKFTGVADFSGKLEEFLSARWQFDPAAYIQENLTLEKCALAYYQIVENLINEL